MLGFFKRIPAAAWFGCWLLSMVGLGSYASWDALVVLMLGLGVFWYGTGARMRLLLAIVAMLGYSSAFMFSGAAYAALALSFAGCAAVVVRDQKTWLKSLAVLFAFLIASVGIAYVTFARPQSAAFWFVSFVFTAWFFLDTLVSESGVGVSRSSTALGAMLVSQISLVVLFLPLGYFAQAFCMTASLWFVSQGIELMEKRVSPKSFISPVLASAGAVWFIVWMAYVSAH